MALLGRTFNDNIDFIYSISRDRYSDSTRTQRYQDVKCRFQDIVILTTAPSSQQVIYRAKAFIDASYDSISEKDEIVKGSETYIVDRIITRKDLSGTIDHYEVWLK